jgi:para-nitrobenzyl esterase
VTSPVDAAKRANPDVEMMIGCTGDENRFFWAFDPTLAEATRDQVVERLGRSFGERAAAAYDRYAASLSRGTSIEVLDAYTSDELFCIPALRIAEHRARAGSPTWLYDFRWATPAYDGRLGSPHCVELPFVFDAVDAWRRHGGTLLDGADPDAVQSLALATHAKWLRFIRRGRDGAADAPWTPFTLPERTTLVIEDAEPEVRADAWGESRRIWEELSSY